VTERMVGGGAGRFPRTDLWTFGAPLLATAAVLAIPLGDGPRSAVRRGHRGGETW
jgi:hypothetical protein